MRSRIVSRRQLLELVGLTIVGAACAPAAPAPAPPAPAPPTSAPAAKPTTAVAAPTTAPSAAPTTAPVVPAGVTLKVAHVTTAQQVWDDAWNGIWKSFETKNPGIKLEVENLPFTGYQEKMLTSFAGGADYDIMYGWEPWLTTFAEKSVILRLDDYLGKDKEIKLDDFLPAAIEKWKGATYGLGWFISGYQTWMNADMLKTANLDPKALEKEGKWAWDTLQDLARQISTGDGANRVFGYMHGINTQGMSTPIWSGGADFWDADGKKSMVNTPEFIDALQQQMDMTLKDHSTPLPADAAVQNGPGFLNKRVASLLTGPHYSRATQEVPDKINIVQVPVPKGKAANRQALALVNSFYLTSVGRNPDQAWLLYKHLLSAETQKAVVPLGGGRFPAFKAAAPQTAYPWEDAEVYKTTASIMRRPWTVSKQAEFEKAWSTATDEILTGKQTVKQSMDDLAKIADAIAT
jgi:ABC-type glycerol-3-phosphate transport system substrate-binding protein